MCGGLASAMSLRQLSDWCAPFRPARRARRHAPAVRHSVGRLDHAKATRLWDWRAQTPVTTILEEIAAHAEAHPEWLDLSRAAVMQLTPAPPLRLFSVVVPPATRRTRCPRHCETSTRRSRARTSRTRSLWWTTAAATRPGRCCRICRRDSHLAPVRTRGHGFGRAVVRGSTTCKGDAFVIMMADASDLPADAVKYWRLLNEGWDCAFGSRFIKGGGVIDYPRVKLFVNRLANLFIRMLFHIPLNDTTNAFKAYRRTVIDGCRPFLSPHFNLTVEIPLKAIVRGFHGPSSPSPGRTANTARPSSRSRKWAAATFSSASTSGWRNISAAGTIGRNPRAPGIPLSPGQPNESH